MSLKPSPSAMTEPDAPAIRTPKSVPSNDSAGPMQRDKRADKSSTDSSKRRCVSTACIACRKRKSKCDGNLPACAACSSVYNTECVYDPNSDHRRKGVYKQDTQNFKTQHATLQVIVESILNCPEDDVFDLVRQMRLCENLDIFADTLRNPQQSTDGAASHIATSPASDDTNGATFETELAIKLGEVKLQDGSTRYVGGTSNLRFLGEETGDDGRSENIQIEDQMEQQSSPITTWTSVTDDEELITHLLDMYFCWHYPFFTTLSKTAFYKDFVIGNPLPTARRKTEYCTPLLVNSMLALGCHFSSRPEARSNPQDASTVGDHFFEEAKRLLSLHAEYEYPKLATVQALGLMSVREAGCGRESKGWTYSGIAFRMACDLGLNLDSNKHGRKNSDTDVEENDVRTMTFWGSFLFDKCWSNYLGRLPLFQSSMNVSTPKFDVIPSEEAEPWAPYTSSGSRGSFEQPSRIRAVAMQIMSLADISGDLVKGFYHPAEADEVLPKQEEVKRLSAIHQRLENWRKGLPKEFDPSVGSLPSVLVMHMFYQLLHIHLFRPFLKYNPESSPLPAHSSPRKLCTNAASAISRILRLYKRSYGLRQICNIAVYFTHSACTIHLLNLPDKNAQRDIVYGVKHLEEIAESWTCARRTLCAISVQARRWKIELPEEAAGVLARTDARFKDPSVSRTDSPRMQGAAVRDAFSIVQEPHIVGARDEQDDLISPLEAEIDFSSFEWTGNLMDMSTEVSHQVATAGPPVTGKSFYGVSPAMSDHLYSAGQIGGSHTASLHNNGLSSSASLSGNRALPSPVERTQIFNDLSQQQATLQQRLAKISPPRAAQTGNSQTTEWPTSTPPGVPQWSLQQQQAAMNRILAQQQQIPSQAQSNQNIASSLMATRRTSQSPLQRQARQTSKVSQSARTSSSQGLQPQNPAVMGQQSNDHSQPTTTGRPSSGDPMFGGVQALLAEGQEYWVRDQTRMASGFGNWGHGGSHPKKRPAEDQGRQNDEDEWGG